MTVYKCFLCTEQFHPVYRPLLRIRCGHSVCESCIDELIKTHQHCPWRCIEYLTRGDAQTLDISVAETDANEDDIAALRLVECLCVCSGSHHTSRHMSSGRWNSSSRTGIACSASTPQTLPPLKLHPSVPRINLPLLPDSQSASMKSLTIRSKHYLPYITRMNDWRERVRSEQYF